MKARFTNFLDSLLDAGVSRRLYLMLYFVGTLIAFGALISQFFPTNDRSIKTDPPVENNVLIANSKGTANTHIGNGDINIYGITIEQYELGLRKSEKKVRDKMKSGLAHEIELLKKEKKEVEIKLLDVESSFKSYIAELAADVEELKIDRDRSTDRVIEKPIEVPINRDTTKIEPALKKVETQSKNPKRQPERMTNKALVNNNVEVRDPNPLQGAINKLKPKKIAGLNNDPVKKRIGNQIYVAVGVIEFKNFPGLDKNQLRELVESAAPSKSSIRIVSTNNKNYDYLISGQVLQASATPQKNRIKFALSSMITANGKKVIDSEEYRLSATVALRADNTLEDTYTVVHRSIRETTSVSKTGIAIRANEFIGEALQQVAKEIFVKITNEKGFKSKPNK